MLPLLYSILSTVEKEHLAGADANQKNKDSLEASQKIAELNEKIARIRSDVYGLPGIGKSPKEQKNQLRSLRKQLEMKKKLIAKYKAINLKVSGLSGSHIAASAGPVSSATVPMTH